MIKLMIKALGDESFELLKYAANEFWHLCNSAQHHYDAPPIFSRIRSYLSIMNFQVRPRSICIDRNVAACPKASKERISKALFSGL